MRPRPTIFACGVLLLLCAGTASAQRPRPSSAEGGDDPPTTDTEEAPAPTEDEGQAHLEKGLAFLERKKFAEAAEQFQAAYDANHQVLALRLLAACQRKLNEVVEAYETYEKILAEHQSEVPKKDVKEITSTMAQLANQIGTFAIESEEDGVEVFANGVSIGKTPFDKAVRLQIDPKHRTYEFTGKKKGFAEVKLKADGVPNKTTTVTISFVGKSLDIGNIDDGPKKDPSGDEPPKDDEPEKKKPAEKGYYFMGDLFFGTNAVGLQQLPCPAEPVGSCTASVSVGYGVVLRAGHKWGPLSLGGVLGILLDGREEKQGIKPNVPADTTPKPPTRTERYVFSSLGLLLGLGGRYTGGGESFGYSLGAAPGLAIRSHSVSRTVTDAKTQKELNGAYEGGAGYVGLGLQLDGRAMIHVSPKFAVTLGAMVQVEVPFGAAVTDGTDSAFKDKTFATVKTPPYTLAQGLQVFVAPTLGVSFGL
jgi:hypothetical protein